MVHRCLGRRVPSYLADYCVPVSTVHGRQHLRSASRRQLIVPRVRCSTFGARAFAIAGPTVWNYLPDSLRDPAVGFDQFRRDLKTHLFEWHCVSFSALAVFSRNALYKSTFYLLTYLPTPPHPTMYPISMQSIMYRHANGRAPLLVRTCILSGWLLLNPCG